MKTIINKAFFGKDNCLKLNLNDKKELYIHIGKKINEWEWNKAKLTDLEVAQIIVLCESENGSTSFYHDYNGQKTQIWLNKSKDYLNVKIKDKAKSLKTPEIIIMNQLLKHSIVRMNLEI